MTDSDSDGENFLSHFSPPIQTPDLPYGSPDEAGNSDLGDNDDSTDDPEKLKKVLYFTYP
jgi:hypothetical protein